ncbi:aldo/keto reductase [Salmonella enterica]|uniref:Aldo/keto reductase n=2 Tax=Salmonella enterica TaxID=28901 RepID=A0A7Z1T5L8_SALET|nr:aldo/keto reductase [Salmonella enterica]PTU39651.1 aldo/keto reductase [Salmonella enterica subsp. enterica]
MSSPILLKDIKIGLGCMGMSQWYGSTNDKESAETILEALDNGVNYLDTAVVYGPYTNEELIGKTIKGKRDKAFIATKFGFPMIKSDGSQIPPDSTPESILRSVHGSLKRLKTDYIDLLYQHRIDPNVPIEDVIGTMSKLVTEGKVRYIGLCEVGVKTLQRAHKVHPISALQAEYSLWERNLEKDIIPIASNLGVSVVAFCPLGRGFLTANKIVPENLDNNDFRLKDPRFEKVNYEKNLLYLDIIKNHAKKKNITPAQYALAWILANKNHIIPIPGTKRRVYLRENIKSTQVFLSEDDIKSLDKDLDKIKVHGDRYNKEMQKYIDR